MELKIIGGGLAGCEAAWQAAQRGAKVVLYEMKPSKYSPAHKYSGHLPFSGNKNKHRSMTLRS